MNPGRSLRLSSLLSLDKLLSDFSLQPLRWDFIIHLQRHNLLPILIYPQINSLIQEKLIVLIRLDDPFDPLREVIRFEIILNVRHPLICCLSLFLPLVYNQLFFRFHEVSEFFREAYLNLGVHLFQGFFTLDPQLVSLLVLE